MPKKEKKKKKIRKKKKAIKKKKKTYITTWKIAGKPRKVKVTKIAKGKYRSKILKPQKRGRKPKPDYEKLTIKKYKGKKKEFWESRIKGKTIKTPIIKGYDLDFQAYKELNKLKAKGKAKRKQAKTLIPAIDKRLRGEKDKQTMKTLRNIKARLRKRKDLDDLIRLKTRTFTKTSLQEMMSNPKQVYRRLLKRIIIGDEDVLNLVIENIHKRKYRLFYEIELDGNFNALGRVEGKRMKGNLVKIYDENKTIQEIANEYSNHFSNGDEINSKILDLIKQEIQWTKDIRLNLPGTLEEIKIRIDFLRGKK